ncbi:Guanine nucleotide-binding protein-like 3 [Nowakowskiella sp. JEL0078]|nr:Guanine nucleotide-binding protein-like 3 [Nowakowskiella sp. JEL0078]
MPVRDHLLNVDTLLRQRFLNIIAKKIEKQKETLFVKKKDPGLPKNLPFRDKILKQIEYHKQRIEEDKQKRKVAWKALSENGNEAPNLVAQLSSTASQNDSFEISTMMDQEDESISVADNSKRANKEFRKVVEAADVILEVLDARDPLGCRTKQIEDLIVDSGANKRVILILNKIDLVPRPVVEAWLKYLRKELPTIAFKASTQSQTINLPTNVANTNLITSKECLGADTLIQLLKNYCRNQKIKTSITVGVIGFPNVGKSSLINSLKNSKVCAVGSTPGLSKSTQEIQLDKNIKLLDCPGIVFSTSIKNKNDPDVLLRNCVKVEILEDPVVPVEYILSRCRIDQLMEIYEIPAFSDTREFLINVARQRGRLRKGGVPDIPNAARVVLQDWNAGRIPYYCMPPADGPAVNTHVSSEVVKMWSKEFNLSSVIKSESQMLVKSVVFERKEKMVELQSGKNAEIDWHVKVSDEEDENLDSENDDDDEGDYDVDLED